MRLESFTFEKLKHKKNILKQFVFFIDLLSVRHEDRCYLQSGSFPKIEFPPILRLLFWRSWFRPKIRDALHWRIRPPSAPSTPAPPSAPSTRMWCAPSKSCCSRRLRRRWFALSWVAHSVDPGARMIVSIFVTFFSSQWNFYWNLSTSFQLSWRFHPGRRWIYRWLGR